jgi:hypothetical protein
MSKKFINPSEEIQNNLKEKIKRMYPDFENLEPSISYDKGDMNQNCLYGAVVTFYRSNGSSPLTALFDYKKNSPRDRDYYWYCSRDWEE